LLGAAGIEGDLVKAGSADTENDRDQGQREQQLQQRKPFL
jgi:hypothetical protein